MKATRGYISRPRPVRAVAGIVALGLLAACATDPGKTGSASSVRSAQPMLWTGEMPAEGFVIDVEKFNGGSEVISQTRVDYIGELNDDDTYRGSPAETAEVQLIRQAGGTNLELEGSLTVNFDGEPLDYFVRQMLGGFLGINYVAAGELAGTVTFRTETPIVRSQVLPVVRSILARHGYVMKLIGGVLHIATPQMASATEQNAAISRDSELVNRLVPFGGPIDESLVQALGAILPAGISVGLSPEGTGLLVRATPAEIEQVEELVASFATGGKQKHLYAIIQLHNNSPENVAEKLGAFFASQTLRGSELPRSIIPLSERQALLVSAVSETAIENVRKIAMQLDYGIEDEVTLRIIPLRHVNAAEMAGQISAVMGDGMLPAGAEDDTASGEDATAGTESQKAQERKSGMEISKVFTGKSSPSASSANDRVAKAFDARPTNKPAFVASPMSIVPDERNNALLVRSNYRQFKRIREAVKILDIPLSQVVIEATILEVKITDALKFGVQWYLSGNGFTLRGSATSGADGTGLTGLVGTFEQLAAGISINAVIDALDDVTEVQVVSSPYLTVMDRKTARLVVGDQIPFTVTSQSASGAGEVAVTQEIQMRDTGVILEVQPIIRADNSIELRIQQELSTPDLSSGTVNLTPTVATRQISSDIMVHSGRTVLLGGLIQDRKDKRSAGVPLLRRTPGIGKLFEQSTNSDVRTEVIVLITPRVARQPMELERITDLLRGRLGMATPEPQDPIILGK